MDSRAGLTEVTPTSTSETEFKQPLTKLWPVLPSLRSMSVSDNVGYYKFVLGALLRALRRVRHFALVESPL